jgi:LCP family protein required for cell wall assembly
MMIISVNTKDKTITMTSIMRDCYVSYQDANGYWYSNRINAAYWTGGISLTQQTIENYLNVKIDRYVLVNFRVFIDIVDTLGGLDLYVSDEEANGYADADPNGTNTRGMQNPLDEQNKYLGNKKGTDYIKKGGNLHLNGNQALAYARLRYIGNSDYERTERQRKVITEMIKKSRDLSIIEMDKLANTILPQIKTDVTKSEAAQLLIDMLDYRNYEIQEFRVPADGTFTDQIIDGKDVLSVDFNTNADMFRELVYGTVELDENGEEEVPTIE